MYNIFKRINMHGISVVIILAMLSVYNWKVGNETFIFFGLAENKETEIRFENPVLVDKVYVSAGSKVLKGDILLEATRSSLSFETSDLNHEVAKLQSQYKMWAQGLESSIRGLKAQKLTLQNEIQSSIDQLESKISINEALFQGLESIASEDEVKVKSPNKIKIEALKREKALAVAPINAEIRKLEQELYASENPLKLQIEKLQNELGYVQTQEEKLMIQAPSDGVVGSIFCKVGEQMPSFSTLMTFYEENPTQVRSYVLESLSLNVAIGDSITVQSSILTESKCIGTIIGMGSRIVEIPERLRKNPDFKTYGREIQIAIPPTNEFLQKEKVVLKLYQK